MFQREELNRAEDFSQKYQLNLHYVDIDWNNTVEKYVDSVMIAKSAPVHSIEPQIMQAATEAKVNGNDVGQVQMIFLAAVISYCQKIGHIKLS